MCREHNLCVTNELFVIKQYISLGARTGSLSVQQAPTLTTHCGTNIENVNRAGRVGGTPLDEADTGDRPTPSRPNLADRGRNYRPENRRGTTVI